MKTILLIIALYFSALAQTIEVKLNYNLHPSTDSAYLYVWKGLETNDCPLFEDSNYKAMDLSNLDKFKVLQGDTLQTFSFSMDGEFIKVGAVAFRGKFYSRMSTTEFYALPKNVQKVTLGSFEIDTMFFKMSYGWLIDENYLGVHNEKGELPKRENGTYLYWQADNNGNLTKLNWIKNK